jgi:hypothetical protein
VPTAENFLANLPEDKEALKAILLSLWQRAETQTKRVDELYLETLRLQKELARLKKSTYGPRADRLSVDQLAQMLLEFAQALEQRPIHAEDLARAEAEPELRKVNGAKDGGLWSTSRNSRSIRTSMS